MMILSDFALPKVRTVGENPDSYFFSDDKTFDDLESKIASIDLEIKN